MRRFHDMLLKFQLLEDPLGDILTFRRFLRGAAPRNINMLGGTVGFRGH
jgi:hypothetical protein